MSRFDYLASQRLILPDPPFAALIMAAYRKADTRNAARLRHEWPEIVGELEARYHAPGGYLPEEAPQDPAAGECRGSASPAAGHQPGHPFGDIFAGTSDTRHRIDDADITDYLRQKGEIS